MVPLPTTERQVRPLAPLRNEPEKVQAAWTRADPHPLGEWGRQVRRIQESGFVGKTEVPVTDHVPLSLSAERWVAAVVAAGPRTAAFAGVVDAAARAWDRAQEHADGPHGRLHMATFHELCRIAEVSSEPTPLPQRKGRRAFFVY